MFIAYMAKTNMWSYKTVLSGCTLTILSMGCGFTQPGAEVLNASAQASTSHFVVCSSENQTVGGLACRYVEGEGLRQAISDAPGNEITTITLKAGTYLFNAPMELEDTSKAALRIKDKHIVLRAEAPNAGQTTLSTVPPSYDGIVLENAVVELRNVMLDGFIRGARIHDSKLTLRDCVFQRIRETHVFSDRSSEVEVYRSEFISGTWGMLLYDTSHASIFDSTFKGQDIGVYAAHESIAEVRASNFPTSQNTAIWGVGSAEIVALGNQIAAGQYGIAIDEHATGILRNNVIQGALSAAIDTNGATSTLSVENNTLHGNAIGIRRWDESDTLLTIHNNLITGVANGSALQIKNRLGIDTVEYNAQDQAGSACEQSQSYCGQGLRTLEAGPEGIYKNVSGGDFHLSANSPARNVGHPDLLDPDGTYSDLGAYGGPDACVLDSALAGCPP